MKVGSLFSGIGGFDLGLERAGMEIVWQVENNPFCNKVLEKHWPNVKRYGDIKNVTNPEPVDLICGGFPCQPYSCAGKRLGAEDDRALWPEMLRVIQEVKPRWVIGENVAGFINMGLDDSISDLEREGYSVQAFIIPACAVNAPHRRDRVWIVAHSEPEGLQGHIQQQTKQTGTHCGCLANCHAPDTTNTGIENVRKPEICSIQNADASDSEGRENNQRNGRSMVAPEGSWECSDSAVSFSDKSFTDTEKSKCEQPRRTRAGQEGFTDDNFNGEWHEPWLEVATRLCRVDDGIPRWVDRVNRLKALGNAVVPQIVEIIGRAIMEIENG